MTTSVREIAFIDTSITDWETLLAGLKEEVEVILLDPAEDGLRQMANALRDRSDLSAIHLFSHGDTGEIILGGMTLNAGNLVDYGDALVTIGNALSETGDILLYGCNVAQGEAGQQFIARLAAETGADVAASTDLTGNAALGGDWVLEAAVGTVEAAPALGVGVEGILGQVITFQPNDGKDTYIRSSVSTNGDMGLDDGELRVGGWADVYYTFIQFDLTGLPQDADSVILKLYEQYGESGVWTYPDMSLWTVNGAWVEGMQWNENTTTATFVRNIGQPDAVGWFEVDITDIYRQWQSGALENSGIQIRPLSTTANIADRVPGRGVRVAQEVMDSGMVGMPVRRSRRTG